MHVVINLTIIPSRPWRPLFHIYDDILTTYMYVVNMSSYMWNRGPHGRDDIIIRFITTYMYVVNKSSYMWNRGRHGRDDIIVRFITTYMYVVDDLYFTYTMTY
jgi:hypothetical protein